MSSGPYASIIGFKTSPAQSTTNGMNSLATDLAIYAKKYFSYTAVSRNLMLIMMTGDADKSKEENASEGDNDDDDDDNHKDAEDEDDVLDDESEEYLAKLEKVSILQSLLLVQVPVRVLISPEIGHRC